MTTPDMKATKIFIGPLVHSEIKEEVSIIPRAAIVVKNGTIQAVEKLLDYSQQTQLKAQFPDADFVTLKDGQFLIPGLIDTHVHAPQFPNAGLGYDKPLLDWLSSYIFRLERRYEDADFAREVYKAVVSRTLRCGTTTAVYFGTIHRSSCRVLAEAVLAAGQRALVGKVNMDICSDHFLQEETSTSVTDTEAFVEDVLALQSSLVRPVITPRFAISCSAALMSQLAVLARRHNIHIQTHMCENKQEISEVLKMFPQAATYADVYDQAKLLDRKTILAHCVHLEEAEVAVVKARGCSVAHCPNSNICLQSGLCDVRRLLTAGVNVSLGTDVAGGCNPSILDAIRLTLSTSISLLFAQIRYKPLTYHEAFYLATMGGAIALDMEDKLGNFAVGKYFDAIIVDTNPQDSPIQVLTELSLAELFQKFIYTGDDRNISEVYVNGNLQVKK